METQVQHVNKLTIATYCKLFISLLLLPTILRAQKFNEQDVVKIIHAYSRLDTTDHCLNTLIHFKFSLTQSHEIVNISATNGMPAYY